MRRVVVTGMGMLAPFGRGVDYNWENIVAGKSAIRRIDEDLELYVSVNPTAHQLVSLP